MLFICQGAFGFSNVTCLRTRFSARCAQPPSRVAVQQQNVHVEYCRHQSQQQKVELRVNRCCVKLHRARAAKYRVISVCADFDCCSYCYVIHIQFDEAFA
jgi:hypothetical protein